MLRQAFFLILIFGAMICQATAQDRTTIERHFRTWLENVVWPVAEVKGVSRNTFEGAFGEVTLNWNLSGLVFPGMEAEAPKVQNQAEFAAPANYFSQRGLDGSAVIGRQMLTKYDETLALVEDRFGIPRRIILAIWGRESGYGRVPITYNAFQVLATRAFASTDNYTIRELVSALKIAEAGHVPLKEMKSSWAGALGQPQFMPASFLAYAADGDGDGRADIWRSEADTMASIANFLQVHGWVSGRDWGYEVRMPNSLSCTIEGPDQGRTFQEWEELGIMRPSGRSFPENERQSEGFLLLPAGRHGPAFIVTPNFSVLKRYNRSDLYALYVGNLGDRIQYSMGDFQARWGSLGKTFRSDILEIQLGLETLGLDVGGADGLPGFKTRRAIGKWQEATGRPATCFPEQWMKDPLAN